MKGTRAKAASALVAGLLCWGVNIVLTLTIGMFGPTLVILGALGVFAGSVGLIWGDSFRTMTAAQKIPAALLPLGLVVLAAVLLLRCLPR